MRRFSGHVVILAALCLSAAPGPTRAGEPDQSYATPPASQRVYSRHGAAPRAQTTPADAPAATAHVPAPLGFYAGYTAPATVSQPPRRMPIQAAPTRPFQRPVKPFQAFQTDPTISPYLNLERQETADDVPNYFAFVRPQIQQLEVNRAQQREIQRLQRQVSGASPGTAAGGTSVRFMDTGQFYGGWQQ